MKKMIYQYVTSTCVVFTFVMLFAAIINGFRSNINEATKWLWMTILLCLLVVCIVQFVQFCISRWDFKSNVTYHLVNFMATFLSSLLFFYFTNFLSFSVESLLSYTLVYVFTYVMVYFYFHKKGKLEADEINQMLQEYKGNLN